MSIKTICFAIVILLDLAAATCSIAADDKFADLWTAYLLVAVAVVIWELRGDAEHMEKVRDMLTVAGSIAFAAYMFLTVFN